MQSIVRQCSPYWHKCSKAFLLVSSLTAALHPHNFRSKAFHLSSNFIPATCMQTFGNEAFCLIIGLTPASCMQTFGKLQAKLFPKYFALLSAACVVCMGTIAFSPGSSLPRSQAISLGEHFSAITSMQAAISYSCSHAVCVHASHAPSNHPVLFSKSYIADALNDCFHRSVLLSGFVTVGYKAPPFSCSYLECSA